MQREIRLQSRFYNNEFPYNVLYGAGTEFMGSERFQSTHTKFTEQREKLCKERIFRISNWMLNKKIQFVFLNLILIKYQRYTVAHKKKHKQPIHIACVRRGYRPTKIEAFPTGHFAIHNHIDTE